MLVPELRQLRYIIAVAEARSLTRAAERMHVAQQALSQQVKVVEDQVGVKLFERGNRGVELTPAGSVFVQEARRVVNGAERVVRRTQAAARGELGTVRLAYTLSAAYETVPAVLQQLERVAPSLRVQQREMTATDIEAALVGGQQDVAVCPRMTVGRTLRRLEVRREPFVAAVGDSHPLAGRAEIAVAELAGDDFQLWPRELTPGYHDAVVAACREAGFEPRLGEPASGATVWGNIAAARGVGLVVNSLAIQLPRGITLIPLRPPAPALSFDLLWSVDHDGPALERVREAAAGAAAAWDGADSPTLRSRS